MYMYIAFCVCIDGCWWFEKQQVFYVKTGFRVNKPCSISPNI